MTPIGHTLTGLAIGYLGLPRDTPTKQKVLLLSSCAVLANIPDFPFSWWGHSRYDISHSLLMTTLGVVCLDAILLWRFRLKPPVTPQMLLAFALAWYSHLLLDMSYNHAKGLAIFWPWSTERVALPIPWLAVGNPRDVFSLHNVRVAFFEILTFGALLVFAILIKNRFTLVRDVVKHSSQNDAASIQSRRAR
jgi:membrane-bound metal-dependent hydrolase YbcI (DUF457 family)